ncbi:hypothetical protein B0H13DRAFT_2337573 [Mycena leptocephala]|nr:hypothetical protein B0H13DRAFT_2337573 [Mycena leptocephala]
MRPSLPRPPSPVILLSPIFSLTPDRIVPFIPDVLLGPLKASAAAATFCHERRHLPRAFRTIPSIEPLHSSYKRRTASVHRTAPLFKRPPPSVLCPSIECGSTPAPARMRPRPPFARACPIHALPLSPINFCRGLRIAAVSRPASLLVDAEHHPPGFPASITLLQTLNMNIFTHIRMCRWNPNALAHDIWRPWLVPPSPPSAMDVGYCRNRAILHEYTTPEAPHDHTPRQTGNLVSLTPSFIHIIHTIQHTRTPIYFHPYSQHVAHALVRRLRHLPAGCRHLQDI